MKPESFVRSEVLVGTLIVTAPVEPFTLVTAPDGVCHVPLLAKNVVASAPKVSVEYFMTPPSFASRIIKESLVSIAALRSTMSPKLDVRFHPLGTKLKMVRLPRPVIYLLSNWNEPPERV